ncbi:hypothetical protein H5410_030623 [Solanum commersonii]|uniref:Uncharacterized protein n=1 Tax=Solanum commersonii TaxID=4109 RepID=A0A9J5YGQ1_SOLCO|nr:hypothetical protein H5410_030623 [Solanum commersonii]
MAITTACGHDHGPWKASWSFLGQGRGTSKCPIHCLTLHEWDHQLWSTSRLVKVLPPQGQVMTKAITTDCGHDHGSWEAPWSCLGQVLASEQKGRHCLQHHGQHHDPW